MNSFIENVNYVAGLDNLYGSGIELYKNNLSLKSVQHDIELKFSYYNNDDKKIHSIVHSEPGVLVGGIDDTLLSFKTLVESSITGSEFTCTVNFVINNISIVNISIVSNSDAYKTYELEMKVVTAGAVTYDVFGEVSDSLKILPSLAMITASDVDTMANLHEIQEEIVTVSESIANVTTVSDSIANVNITGTNITDVNTVGINITDIGTVSNNIANVNITANDIVSINTVSSNIADVNTVSDGITNVNIVSGSVSNVNTVASNIVGLNSIVSNMTEILLADYNATIATTKASEALASAISASTSASTAATSATNSATSETNSLASKNAASTSATSASGSAATATTKASEASTSATNAATSATASSNSAIASATSATNASASAAAATTSSTSATASATSAATSASTATTKAAETATSATSASTSATSASNSATTSTAKASEASTSASNAALSATNSANSATNAATSATASATSATNSANSATDAAASAVLALEYKESINPSIFNLKISTQQFDKPTRGPLFVKVSPSSIKIPAGLKITVGTESFNVLTDYILTLASNLVGSTKTAGTDYYVYAKSNSTFYISANDAITTDRLIGGFHYGLVGETETATGNKLEADMVKIRGINQYSFWDLKYRPVASTKGMVKIGSEWYDIYLLNSEHIANGTSKAGLTIAGGITDYGRAIPKIPLEYGGNNTLNYGKFTWFQACEVAKANAKRLISYSEFPTIAYGVLEGVSSSTNSYETVAGKIEHYPNLTSKFGIEQATGVQNIYGDNLMNGHGTTSFASNTTSTDSRGGISATLNSPTAVLLGGSRDYGEAAGSRASYWGFYVWNSNWSIGCRFACDHLELV